MKIVVLGAGHVGRTIVEALHDEHEITVIDVDPAKLAPLLSNYDVRVIEGNGTTKRVIRESGAEDADLLIACSSREDANLVCAMLVKRRSAAQTIVRTTSVEYLEAWREREIDVDFMVSSELETANTILRQVGIPAARQTDVFADGQVQIVEFDVPDDAARGLIVGRPLREAAMPPDSKVAALIRGDRMILPRGSETVCPGDRIIVIASPTSAQAWSGMIGRAERKVEDIVVFGAGHMGTMVARVLGERGIDVRLVDARQERAHEAAEQLPHARVFHASAFDREFLARERIGPTTAAVFCMNDDARNLYGATLARLHGVELTIALAHDPASVDVYDRGGVDVAVNPRQVIAEEVVRFAHDPRIRQIAMLEDDRFEILDLTVRADSALTNRPLRELPETTSLVGAIIRNGRAIFPSGSEVLLPGDRAVVFVESRRASEVERAL